MIESQLYNLLIIQTLGPLIGDIFKGFINENKHTLNEWITISTVLSFLSVYFLWKYKTNLYTSIRNLIKAKKAIYKLTGTIHYANKEILKHGQDNMKNINSIVHYIINVIKPEFNRKTLFHIKTKNPDGIKIYRIPERCIFKYFSSEIEIIFNKHKENLSETVTLVIKAKSYDIIDNLITNSYNYHKSTIDDIDSDNYKDYIYILKNPGATYLLYNQYNYKNKASFDNLFINKKDLLIQHLSEFKNGTSKHSFLSLLLHGKPGTGKTSIIKMMANYFNRSIIYIKLNEIKSFRSLLDIIHNKLYEIEDKCDEYKYINIGKNKIIVFEDIDACCENLIKKRGKAKNKSKKELSNYDEDSKLTFDDLLNALNGVIPNDELIFVMTTNYVEKIDNALIRPGRITLNLELNEINKDIICSMIYKYYPELDIDKIQDDITINKIIPCILENIIRNTTTYEELLKILQDTDKLEEFNSKYNN
jgi:Cdc6-like AAA superfamily ATPase